TSSSASYSAGIRDHGPTEKAVVPGLWRGRTRPVPAHDLVGLLIRLRDQVWPGGSDEGHGAESAAPVASKVWCQTWLAPMRSWCQVCGNTDGRFKWACSWDCRSVLNILIFRKKVGDPLRP